VEGSNRSGDVAGAGSNSSEQATTITSSCGVASSSRQPQPTPKLLVPNSSLQVVLSIKFRDAKSILIRSTLRKIMNK
jgi:hypothetical protein